MFQETRSVKSILWGQGTNRYPIEQIIGANSGIRVHVSNSISRDSLIELALCIRPDILVFESSISGNKSWSQVLSALKLKMPELGLIAITQSIEMDNIHELTRAQVDSIVKSDKVALELPHGIRAYQRNETFLNPQIARVLCSFVNNIAKDSNSTLTEQVIKQDHGLLPTLTNRELEILSCLTQGLNYKEIAKNLFVSSSTVKTHVNNIFTKLNINDRTQAVLYGLKYGIDKMVPNLFNGSNVKNSGQEQTQTNIVNVNSLDMNNYKTNYRYV